MSRTSFAQRGTLITIKVPVGDQKRRVARPCIKSYTDETLKWCNSLARGDKGYVSAGNNRGIYISSLFKLRDLPHFKDCYILKKSYDWLRISRKQFR